MSGADHTVLEGAEVDTPARGTRGEHLMQEELGTECRAQRSMPTKCAGFCIRR